jgi:uncharacterized protein (TIGR00288 family)
LDVELVIDALNHRDNFDTFILMSGDSDFAPLFDELKKRGKRVIVISAKKHVAIELIVRAKYVNINKLRTRISYKTKSPSP